MHIHVIEIITRAIKIENSLFIVNKYNNIYCTNKYLLYKNANKISLFLGVGEEGVTGSLRLRKNKWFTQGLIVSDQHEIFSCLQAPKMVLLPLKKKVFGMNMYTLLYWKWITNKNLLYSTGNSVLCYVAACMGGNLGENGYM